MFFILEDKNHMGFKRDLMQNYEGLDYEHSVLGEIIKNIIIKLFSEIELIAGQFCTFSNLI